jgi:hypothetical protein
MRDARRLKGARPLCSEPVDQAAKGECKQYDGTERHFDHLDPRLGDRVIGRFLVRGERDGIRKHLWHRVTMCAHIADLPSGEPELCRGCSHQRANEKPSHCIAHSKK